LRSKDSEWSLWTALLIAWCLITKSAHTKTCPSEWLISVSSIVTRSLVLYLALLVSVDSVRMMPTSSAELINSWTKF
jgi:hypothetical protein